MEKKKNLEIFKETASWEEMEKKIAALPDVKYQELFVKPEKEARVQRRGLWG